MLSGTFLLGHLNAPDLTLIAPSVSVLTWGKCTYMGLADKTKCTLHGPGWQMQYKTFYLSDHTRIKE